MFKNDYLAYFLLVFGQVIWLRDKYKVHLQHKAKAI